MEGAEAEGVVREVVLTSGSALSRYWWCQDMYNRELSVTFVSCKISNTIITKEASKNNINIIIINDSLWYYECMPH